MTTNDYLAIAVTCIGGILCLIFMAFLFFGAKIPGEEGKPQVIKYKGIELQTTSIIMVLIISAIITILPFALNSYLPYLSLSKTPYEVWHITGRVILTNEESLLPSDITINPPNVNVSRGGSFDLDVPIVKKQGNVFKYPTLSVGHPGFTTVDINLEDNAPLGGPAVQVKKDLKSKTITVQPVTLLLVTPYDQAGGNQ